MKLFRKLFRKPWFLCTLIGLMVLFFIWAAYHWSWSGTGFQGKTLWDWLSLLIIPLALALVALVFNQANTRTERAIADQRYKQEQEITKQRYEQDQEIALDKQRDDLFREYVDRISDLLLHEGLRTSEVDAEVRNVARTRTISVLRQLDARRVSDLFTFLRGAGLMNDSDPIISLDDADLSRVNWSEAYLTGVNLTGVNLTGADLSEARLVFTNLSSADLDGANLSSADLDGANLDGASLRGTSLRGADLDGADLSRARLNHAEIDKSKLTPEQIAQAYWW